MEFEIMETDDLRPENLVLTRMSHSVPENNARSMESFHHGIKSQLKNFDHTTNTGLRVLDSNIPLKPKQNNACVRYGKENQSDSYLYRSEVVRSSGFIKCPLISLNTMYTSPSDWPEYYASQYDLEVIEYLLSVEEEIPLLSMNVNLNRQRHRIVVNWLIRVQHKLNLAGGVLFLAVALMDKILARKFIVSCKLQLVACTALWIAAKFIGEKKAVPDVLEFIRLSDQSFTRKDMYQMEIFILNAVKFKLAAVDPLTFVTYYLQVLNIGDKKAFYICNYLLDIIYTEMIYAVKRPSLLAAAAVYNILIMTGKDDVWNRYENRSRALNTQKGSWSHFTTARLIKQHTLITTEHLTPEIKLRLITPECPLWTANADNIPFEDPYWAFYWPGGQAVARFVLDNPQLMKGKYVLDVGSGSGACAIAAAKSGARKVTANDIDLVAITAIQLNSAINEVSIDLCSKNLLGNNCDDWNCILLGDMFYDSEFAKQLIEWLSSVSRKKKLVLIGDPGRHAFKIIEENSVIEMATYKMTEQLAKQNNGFTDVTVWKLN